MREVSDDAVVIDGRLGVDDDAPSDAHARRNDRAGADHRSVPDDRAWRDAGSRMNRRDQPLSGGEQPLRHGASRTIVAQGDNHRVMGDVPQRRNRREHIEAEHGGSQKVRRVVDESNRHCVGARLVRALQDVGNDRSLSSGTNDDDSHTCAIVAQ